MPIVQGITATLPEYNIARTLDKMGLAYEFQTSFMGGRYIAGGAISDFYLPGYSLVITVLGTYWHSTPEVRAKDKLQSIALLSRGITTIGIDEADANKNPQYFISEAIRGIDHSQLVNR